jgi:hypothetical protein
MLRVLSGARGGYRHDYGKDLAQVRALSVDFPRVDMLEEVKKMAAWLIDKPDSRVKNPRAFMRNWIVRAAKTHAAPNAPPSGDDGRTPAARASPDGIPDPDEIQRRFDAKYSRVEHVKHAKYAKTGGVVIDV